MTTLAAAIALSVPAASAFATPNWSPARTVARTTCPSGSVGVLRSAQNARGDRLLAWVEHCPGTQRVVAATQRPGRALGAPKVLSELHGRDWDVGLQTALDARGRAVVAWTRTMYGLSGRLAVVSHDPGRRFQRPLRLDEAATELALAGNPRGDVLLAWRHGANRDRLARVVATLRPAGTRGFAPPQEVSEPLVDALNGPQGGRNGIHPTPAVALADDGTAIVAWKRANGLRSDCCEAVEATVRAADASAFPTAEPISGAYAYTPLYPPAVTVADRGDAWVGWIAKEFAFYPTPSSLGAAHWDGHTFAPPATLVQTTSSPFALGVFVGGGLLLRGGDALLQWQSFGDPCTSGAEGGERFQGITLHAGAAASAPTDLVPTDRLYAGFASTLDRDGRRVTAWFNGELFYPDRYGCVTRPVALAGAVDGGSPIAGPRVGRVSAFALAGAPGPTPTMVWVAGDRLRLSELRDY